MAAPVCRRWSSKIRTPNGKMLLKRGINILKLAEGLKENQSRWSEWAPDRRRALG